MLEVYLFLAILCMFKVPVPSNFNCEQKKRDSGIT